MHPGGEGIKYINKSTDLISKTTTLFMYHTFFAHVFASMNAHDAKMPNFPYYGGRKQATMKFFLFFNLNIQGS